MSMYNAICITNRQLLTGTDAYNPEIRSRILSRIAFIAENKLADAVILREKDLSEAEYADLAEGVNTLCVQENFPLILHQFADVAASFSPALPLHLRFADFTARSRHLPSRCNANGNVKGNAKEHSIPFFGVSTHSVEEAIRAEALGAAYITASHIFPTACKENLAPRGLSYLQQVCQAVSIPVYALGGIHPPQIGDCLDAGAAGVCMMSEYFSPHLTLDKSKKIHDNIRRKNESRF